LVKYEYTVDGKPYSCETVTPAEFMLPDAWAESVSSPSVRRPKQNTIPMTLACGAAI
jgi:hypothetical protein